MEAIAIYSCGLWGLKILDIIDDLIVYENPTSNEIETSLIHYEEEVPYFMVEDLKIPLDECLRI